MVRDRSDFRALFVTASETGSGEAVTALHMAKMVAAKGASFHILSSMFTAQFVPKPLRRHITVCTPFQAQNEKIWFNVVRKFRPNAVIFADYPLLFFASGSVPLVNDRWVRSLETLDAAIVTLDHLGYAQEPMSISFAPPHLAIHSETMPVLPKRMQILLPCPIHEPSVLSARKGTPFRYWHLPLCLENGQRQKVRDRFLRNKRELLIFHSVPTWAWKIAEIFALPYYPFLSEILQHHLANLPRPSTVISVNNGRLLTPHNRGEIRILNLASVQKDEYERFLLASDLMLTENMVSASLGKAICGLIPSAVLCNQYRVQELMKKVKDKTLRNILTKMEGVRLGSIFPYEVFPIWAQQDLVQLGVFRDNTFKEAFTRIEVFADEPGPSPLCGLLTDSHTREKLEAKQRKYSEGVNALPDAFEALHQLVSRCLR